jgi:hypothetical protein
MSAQRRGTELGRVAVVAALLPLILAIGCERPASGGKSIAERSATPEGQLENVMKRLEYALDLARPAAGTGVVSERRSAHRLIPPAGDQAAYEAEVTISTSMGLAPEKVDEIKKQTKVKPVALDSQAPVEGNAEAPADLEEPQQDPAEKIAAAAEVSETKIYKLRFQNDRWELVDPPADKLTGADGECVKYALSDG